MGATTPLGIEYHRIKTFSFLWSRSHCNTNTFSSFAIGCLRLEEIPAFRAESVARQCAYKTLNSVIAEAELFEWKTVSDRSQKYTLQAKIYCNWFIVNVFSYSARVRIMCMKRARVSSTWRILQCSVFEMSTGRENARRGWAVRISENIVDLSRVHSLLPMLRNPTTGQCGNRVLSKGWAIR